MAPSLLKRANCDTFDNDSDCGSWLWSDTGLAVRYGIVVLFFALIVGFLVGSYIHAQRRLKKGMPPLNYHRWLVSRRHYNNYNNYHGGPPGPNNYHMNNQQPGWQNPPPAYNNWDAPPQYQPPPGGSKTLPNQHMPGPQQSSGPEQAQGSSQQGGGAPDAHLQPPAPAHTGAPTVRYN